METKEGPNGTLEIRIENHISISDLFKNYFRQNKKVMLLVVVKYFLLGSCGFLQQQKCKMWRSCKWIYLNRLHLLTKNELMFD